MNKRTFTIAGVSGILLFAAVAFADFKPSDWQFKKSVRTNTMSLTQYVQMTVEREVYAKSTLSDLRVVDSSGGEVPYQLVVKNSSGNDQYY